MQRCSIIKLPRKERFYVNIHLAVTDPRVRCYAKITQCPLALGGRDKTDVTLRKNSRSLKD